jgi:TPR repeat protein
MLGWPFFLNGHGIQMNKSLAAHYFKLSADQGYMHGRYQYGKLLLFGEGIPKIMTLNLRRSAAVGKAKAKPECYFRFSFENAQKLIILAPSKSGP